MKIEDAKRKVRSLLALAAPGSGATDAERASARAMAENLTKAYGLDRPHRPTITVTASGASFDFNFLRDAIVQSINADNEERIEEKRKAFRDTLNGNW